MTVDTPADCVQSRRMRPLSPDGGDAPTVSVRLRRDTLAAVEALRASLEAATRIPVSTGAALRVLVEEALAARAAAAAAPPPFPPPTPVARPTRDRRGSR